MVLYVNGQVVASGTLITSLTETTERWSMGSRPYDTVNRFHGVIHEIRVYDRVHGDAEVASTYATLKAKWGL